MPYDNIKSHKKPGFHPLFGRYIFRETTGGGQFAPPRAPAVLGLRSLQIKSFVKRSTFTDL